MIFPVIHRPNPVYKAAAAAPPFSPANVAGLQLWLKNGTGLFQDATGTTPAVNTGDVVGLWKDQSGHGNDCSQATTASKPLLELSQVNGKASVRFNGTNSFLQAADVAGLRLSAAAGIFAVVKFAGMVNESLLCKGATAAAPDFLYSAGRAGDANANGLSLYDGTTWRDSAANAVGITAFALAELTFSAQTLTFYVNATLIGASIATGRNWNTSANPLYVGYQVTTNSLNGDLAELLIYNQAPSASDRASIETYYRSLFALW